MSKFNKSGMLLANAPYGSENRAFPIAAGVFCCDTDVTICDYQADVNVTAAEVILGIQVTFKGVQQTLQFNNGAGIQIPAGGSADSTKAAKAAFVAALAKYLINVGEADVTLAANTLTFFAKSNDSFVLDNVVALSGNTAFATSNCALA